MSSELLSSPPQNTTNVNTQNVLSPRSLAVGLLLRLLSFCWLALVHAITLAIPLAVVLAVVKLDC